MNRRSFLGALGAATFFLVAGLKPIEPRKSGWYGSLFDWDEINRATLENYSSAVVEQIFAQNPFFQSLRSRAVV